MACIHTLFAKITKLHLTSLVPYNERKHYFLQHSTYNLFNYLAQSIYNSFFFFCILAFFKLNQTKKGAKMNCIKHNDVVAVGSCGKCNAGLCTECINDAVRDDDNKPMCQNAH